MKAYRMKLRLEALEILIKQDYVRAYFYRQQLREAQKKLRGLLP